MTVDPRRLLELLQAGMRMAGVVGDAWEAAAEVGREDSARLATSHLVQHASRREPRLRVRVWRDGRQATVRSAALAGAEDVAAAARRAALLCDALPCPERAAQAARRAEPLLPLPAEGLPPGAGGELWSEETASTSEEWCVSGALRLVRALAAEGIEAHGGLAVRATVCAVANSRGLATWHRGTAAGAWLLATRRGRTGSSCALRRAAARIDLAALAEDAAARVMAGPRWEKSRAGRCAVLFEPAAVAALLRAFAPALPAAAAAWPAPARPDGDALAPRGTSPPKLVVRSFGLEPPDDAPGRAADSSGWPGHARTLLPAAASAPATGLQPAPGVCDGAAPADTEEDGPRHLEIPAGRSTIEELLSRVGAGVWVTRLGASSMLCADGQGAPLLHAPTAGGTFAIRGGCLGPRLEEGMLAISLPELLTGLAGVTRERSAVPWIAPAQGALVVPSLLVRGVWFGP